MTLYGSLVIAPPYRQGLPSKEITAIRPSAAPENPTNTEWSEGFFDPKVYYENIRLCFH
jgi:hypothetical protein